MDPDPTPTPVSTPLFSDFKDANNLYEKSEGSGTGSISLTNGSGSGRPKNMWILRIQIEIPNTGS
jgi:hypothetical protein